MCGRRLRRWTSDPSANPGVFPVTACALICGSSSCTVKHANLLGLGDRRCAEVHVELSGRDQQIDLITFRSLLQQIAQEDPWLRPHSLSDGLIDKSVHTCEIKSEVVLQKLKVSLKNP